MFFTWLSCVISENHVFCHFCDVSIWTFVLKAAWMMDVSSSLSKITGFTSWTGARRSRCWNYGWESGCFFFSPVIVSSLNRRTLPPSFALEKTACFRASSNCWIFFESSSLRCVDFNLLTLHSLTSSSFFSFKRFILRSFISLLLSL